MTKKGIIWSYTKGEFVVFDHYYFSNLYKYITDNYSLEIPTKFNDLLKIAQKPEFKTIIFNYPEKTFTQKQIQQIIHLFQNGKNIIFLTYYKNEDNSSQIVNSVIQNLGITINYDEVTQEQEIHNNDKYLIITSKINDQLNKNVKNIIMPCTSSLKISPLSKYSYKVLVETRNKIIAAEVNSKGKIIVFGTCVFWDNFSISMYDNFQFVKNLLNYSVGG